MAKHKPQRALFEILAKEKAQRRAAEPQAGPVIRRMGGAEGGPAAAQTARAQQAGRLNVNGTAAQTARAAPFDKAQGKQAGRPNVNGIPPRHGGVERWNAKYVWIGVAAVAVACLCLFFYALGMWLSGPALPSEPEQPTMEEVIGGPPEPGLVPPAPPAPVLPPPAPLPPAPAAEGKYRLRIARLEVSRSEYTDQLRTLLAERGVETDLEARSGYFVLYSQARFASLEADDAKAFLGKVEAVQKEFERKTGWPATTNPYFVTVP